MRVSREQAALNRERIVEVASKLFREKGYEGIGVADLMKGAGLTHGGFYGHFESKEDLLAEACGKAMEGSVAKWQKILAKGAGEPLSALARAYMTTAHRDNPGIGCAVASLGPDVARAGDQVRHAFTEGARVQLRMLADTLEGSPEEQMRQSIAAYAALIGGLVLSRAVDDPKLSKEVLEAVVAQLEKA
ncbi:TetR/AcrR family transcriptional regulator [Pseudoduganella sp. RAF19]